ncbi:Tannase/feruloyl esterase [Xylariales sp. PMI_506]|nr:Tannase/feruloyl esterase [Xylariales sp. PMI_506]
MVNQFVRLVAIATLTLGTQVQAAASQWPNLDACQSNSSAVKSVIESVLPSNASVERVEWVDQGGTYGEGVLDLNYPIQPTNLPSLCAVTIDVISSGNSSYRFGLFLPADWNSRFLAIGNGGFGGGINWLDMGSSSHYGFAVVSTDTGHNSTTADMTWALDNVEKKTDWAWRALQGSVEIAKTVVEAFYSCEIAYSYYNGCSTGGRQGLKQIQIQPDTFDGVIIGAPSWDVSHINNWVTKVGTYNLPQTAPYYFDWTLYPAMQQLVSDQCDHLDGIVDGIISNPDACQPDYTQMLCSNEGADPTACLTEDQIPTPLKVYADYVDSTTGEFLYPGLYPGAEGQWFAVLNYSDTSPFGIDYDRYMLLDDPSFDWPSYNDSLVAYADSVDPGSPTAADYDLSTFRDLGNKLVLYHGMADGLVPPKGSKLYYDRVLDQLGEQPEEAADWFRFFWVPGMMHCSSATTDTVGAPWNIAGEFQTTSMDTGLWSVPGFEDSDHDVVLAVMDWVERGRAPDAIVATAWNEPFNATSGVKRQRPLCPYPKVAKWDGCGDQDEAASWNCEDPGEEAAAMSLLRELIGLMRNPLQLLRRAGGL